MSKHDYTPELPGVEIRHPRTLGLFLAVYLGGIVLAVTTCRAEQAEDRRAAAVAAVSDSAQRATEDSLQLEAERAFRVDAGCAADFYECHEARLHAEQLR
jgi:hypothetical protein